MSGLEFRRLGAFSNPNLAFIQKLTQRPLFQQTARPFLPPRPLSYCASSGMESD